jgi:hypothetical protein
MKSKWKEGMAGPWKEGLAIDEYYELHSDLQGEISEEAARIAKEIAILALSIEPTLERLQAKSGGAFSVKSLEILDCDPVHVHIYVKITTEGGKEVKCWFETEFEFEREDEDYLIQLLSEG